MLSYWNQCQGIQFQTLLWIKFHAVISNFLNLFSLWVEKLQAHWEESHTKLMGRVIQLQNMYQDSKDWLDAMKVVESHIKQASEKLESWKEVPLSADHPNVKVIWLHFSPVFCLVTQTHVVQRWKCGDLFIICYITLCFYWIYTKSNLFN